MCACVVSVVCGIDSLINCRIIVRTVKEKKREYVQEFATWQPQAVEVCACGNLNLSVCMCACVVSVVCGIDSLFKCRIIVRTVKEEKREYVQEFATWPP